MNTAKGLPAMLQQDAFTAAIQGAWDAFQARSNVRTFGVPDPQVWADETIRRFRPRSPAQAVESVMVEAIHALRRGHKNKARKAINRAKYLLVEYV